MPETLVLLHGFSGTRRAWDGVIAAPRPRTLPAAGPRPPGHGERPAPQRPITFAGCVRARARARPGALRAVRLLARRARRAARRARRARARRAARARLRAARASRTPPSAPRGARPTTVLADGWNGLRSRTSSSAGAPSRCSPATRPRSASSRARTSGATTRTRSRRRCAASAPGRWSRCGIGSASLTMPVTVVAGERDAKFVRSGERMVELLPDAELAVLPGGHAWRWRAPAPLAALTGPSDRIEASSCGGVAALRRRNRNPRPGWHDADQPGAARDRGWTSPRFPTRRSRCGGRLLRARRCGLTRSVYIKERSYAEFETGNVTLSVYGAARRWACEFHARQQSDGAARPSDRGGRPSQRSNSAASPSRRDTLRHGCRATWRSIADPDVQRARCCTYR